MFGPVFVLLTRGFFRFKKCPACNAETYPVCRWSTRRGMVHVELYGVEFNAWAGQSRDFDYLKAFLISLVMALAMAAWFSDV